MPLRRRNFLVLLGSGTSAAIVGADFLKANLVGATTQLLAIANERQIIAAVDSIGEGWERLGGVFSSATGVSPVSWGDGRFDIFCIAGDGSAWHKGWSDAGGWFPSGEGWNRIGGSFKQGTRLSAVSWGKGRFDIFGIAGDGSAWHKGWSDAEGWFPLGEVWNRIGGSFSTTTGLTSVSWGADRFDVFGIAGDGSAWHKGWSNAEGWFPSGEGWNRIGGSFLPSSKIEAVSWGANRIDLFGIAGNAVWHKSWNGSDWEPLGQGWSRLGGSFKPGTDVRAVSWSVNRIDLFGIAGDAVWHRASIEPAAPYSVLGSEIKITTGTSVGEVTAVAINRKVIFSVGRPFLVLRSSLGVSGTPEDVTAQIRSSPPGQNTTTVGTDNQIVRLPNGDLLMARMGGVTHEINPRPDWWNTPGLAVPGNRAALMFYRSSDAGKTWSRDPISILDPAKVAFPYTDENGNQQVEIGRSAYPQNKNRDGKYEQGGWDRPDVYVDPWDLNGRVYVYLNSDSGTDDYSAHRTGKSIVFASNDGGKTWLSDGNGNPKPIWVLPDKPWPPAITTTPQGQLFIFNYLGGKPTIHVSNDRGQTFHSWNVYYANDAQNGQWGAYSDESAFKTVPAKLQNAWTCSISRAADGVRIVYPSRKGSGSSARQIARAIFVRCPDPTKTPEVQDIGEIVAKDPNGHVLYPTFIESDRVELPHKNSSDAAVLYWVETAGNKIFTRYSVMHGETSYSAPADLSSSAWTPQTSFDIGDYMKGAFFFDGQLNYLAQWPQREGNNINLHYRVIRVQPLETPS